jgi:hypothetical protein
MGKFSSGQELIKTIEVRQRDLNQRHYVRRKRWIGDRRFAIRDTLHPLDDAVGMKVFEAATALDGILNPFHRMGGQELQDADVLAGAAGLAMARLQPLTQCREFRRQAPAAINIGMIQGRRATAEGHQIMEGIENLPAVFIAAVMAGDQLITGDDVDMVHVTFDRDGLKGEGSRHAVANRIELDRLILVYQCGLVDAGIEWPDRE